MTGAVTVNAGANIAPGNGGNNTAILTTGPLTLASTSNFRVDINGTTAGTGYDRLSVATGGVTITSQSGQHCRPGRHFSFWTKSPGAALPATLRGSHKGVPWWAATVPFSRSLTTQAMATTSCSRWVAVPVPEPSTWIGGVLATAGLVFTQRRRLRKAPIFRYMSRWALSKSHSGF